MIQSVTAREHRPPFVSVHFSSDYLNSATNFLDKKIAAHIIDLFSAFLLHWIPRPPAGTVYLCVGMEMAGGVYVLFSGSMMVDSTYILGDAMEPLAVERQVLDHPLDAHP